MNHSIPKFCILLTAVGGWGVNTQSHAAQYKFGNGWESKIDSSVSVGSGWRAESQDPKLYTRLNGESVGKTGGLGSASVDSGNLNYDKGDRFTTQFKLLSDLQLSNGNYGGFVRLKGWYDDAMENSDVRVGNQANHYQKNSPLSDDGVDRLAKYKGFEVLDSYVWSKFNLSEHPTELRLGRQSIPWGGSIFFQGVNLVNPVNLAALRRPGVDTRKEMNVPIWSAFGKMENVLGGTVESFYQIKWQGSILESCSTYWASLEMGLTTSPGSACSATALLPGAIPEVQFQNGNYIPLGQGKDGSDSGQFGLAYRYHFKDLKTDLGLFAMQINSRTPIISTRMGDDPEGALLNGPQSVEKLGLKPAEGFWEYPDDVRIFGITTKSKLGAWTVGSEFTYTPNHPVQRSANDILLATLTGKGPLAEQGLAAREQGVGTDIGGYDRLEKSQLLINGVTTLPSIFNAQKSSLIAELATQYTNVGDSYTDIRYGRGFIFGTGAHESLGGGECLITTTQPDGCKNDGYVTDFSWGYRLKAQLDYNNNIITGLGISPNIFWAHDVNGYSSDSQLLEGRRSLGLGLKLNYATTVLDLNYVTFANSAKYDNFRDHDYMSIAMTYGF